MTSPELVIHKNRWGRSVHRYRYEETEHPSVTNILGVLKPWGLVNAAAKEVAWAIAKQRRQFLALAETDERAAVEMFKGAHWKAWNAKRDRGINVHAMIAVGAEPSEVEAPYVAQYEIWKEASGAEVLAQEIPVVHPDAGYGGSVDLDARVNGEVVTIDLKVRDDLRIFPERLLQVAAYAVALVGHPEPPTAAAVLTLGAEGYSYDEVEDLSAASDAFVGLLAYFTWLEANDE